MKKNAQPFQLVFIIGLITLSACKSTKNSQSQVDSPKQIVETASRCNQTIRYYADKLKMVHGGQEVDAKTEIVINPSTKLISLTSEPPNQEKVTFDTVIENVDCNFNPGLTEGKSIYTGYVKHPDGTTDKAIIKVEASAGAVTISSADPEKESEFIIIITKWEVVRE